MKFAALISGGKDSTFNILECLHQGHELVALVNLRPPEKSGKDELDSYMYQSVGHEAIETICSAMGDVPLYRGDILGTAVSTNLQYSSNVHSQYNECDEVEDLYNILLRVKRDMPDLKAVSSGAILSNYQRTRVENVCQRLQLISLAFMWQRSQPELLRSMLDCHMDPILIKIAAMGLTERSHLGKRMIDVYDDLIVKSQLYGLNPCGEGGEYETLTLDAPFFQRSVEIVASENVTLTDDCCAAVKYMKITSLKLREKDEGSFCKSSEFYTSELCQSLPLKSVSECRSIIEELSEELMHIMENVCYCDKIMMDNVCRRPRLLVMSGHGYPDKEIEGGQSAQRAMEDAISEIDGYLTDLGLGKESVVYCVLVVHNMSFFVDINRGYCAYFPCVNPPPRTCVQASQSHVTLHCLVDTDGRYGSNRRSMHIQSLSHWAPANIGPYSQAVCLESRDCGNWADGDGEEDEGIEEMGSTKVKEEMEDEGSNEEIGSTKNKDGIEYEGDKEMKIKKNKDAREDRGTEEDIKYDKFCLLSGQIAMHPETLEMIKSDDHFDQVTAECLLSLRHVTRVAWEHARLSWGHLSMMVCYTTNDTHMHQCKSVLHDSVCRQWTHCFCSRVIWLQVSGLPKNAVVEWQATFSATSSIESVASTNDDLRQLNNALLFTTDNTQSFIAGVIPVSNIFNTDQSQTSSIVIGY